MDCLVTVATMLAEAAANAMVRVREVVALVVGVVGEAVVGSVDVVG